VPAPSIVPNPKSRLKDQFHEVCRFRHLAVRTEEAYWGWTVRFLRYRKRDGEWRHPKDLDSTEIGSYLTYLATHRNVAASTQNQALNALVILFQQVLGHPPEAFGEFEPATPPRRLPTPFPLPPPNPTLNRNPNPAPKTPNFEAMGRIGGHWGFRTLGEEFRLGLRL